jgi:hypothetical protein
MDVKTVLLNRVIEGETYRTTSIFRGIPERDPCMKIEEDLVWIQETWCKASHVQKNSGENFL